jgi:hypothetical protein
LATSAITNPDPDPTLALHYSHPSFSLSSSGKGGSATADIYSSPLVEAIKQADLLAGGSGSKKQKKTLSSSYNANFV